MPPGSLKSARRCLFGRPKDNSLEEELTAKLDDALKAKEKEWSFDFKSDSPIDADVEALSAHDVPSFYHSRTHKKSGVVCQDLPSTSTTIHTSIRVTRATKRRLETENGTTTQKQASIMNFVTVTKRRSGNAELSEKTPRKLLRSDSSDSSPFRYVSAEAEKRTRFPKSPSPMISPRKSPRKKTSPKLMKKASPRKNLLTGRLRRNILSS